MTPNWLKNVDLFFIVFSELSPHFFLYFFPFRDPKLQEPREFMRCQTWQPWCLPLATWIKRVLCVHISFFLFERLVFFILHCESQIPTAGLRVSNELIHVIGRKVVIAWPLFEIPISLLKDFPSSFIYVLNILFPRDSKIDASGSVDESFFAYSLHGRSWAKPQH